MAITILTTHNIVQHIKVEAWIDQRSATHRFSHIVNDIYVYVDVYRYFIIYAFSLRDMWWMI